MKCELAEYCSVISYISSMTDDLEQLLVTLNFPNQRNMNVGVVYRPPGSALEKGIQQLRSSLELLISNSNKDNIILGDVNINYKLRHSHPFELLKKIERDFGLKQLIHTDTGITARSSTLIHIILTDCECIKASGVLELCISDHYAVYMVKKKPRLKHQKVKSTGRT